MLCMLNPCPHFGLEIGSQSCIWDRCFDLCVRSMKNKIVIGVCNKRGDFDLEVTNFPFPESNIHTVLTIQYLIDR